MVVVFGVGFALSLHAQEKDGVKIEADPSVRSEAVRVHYFLVGGFGGYGGFTDVPPKLSTGELFLPIYRDAQRAHSLKAVVYAKGCELAIFTLDPLPPGPSRVRFECRRLRTTRLKGVVIGYPRPSELTVRIRYTANWSHTFFGIVDGAVLSFLIAEIVPEPDGGLAIEVPDFANDTVTNSYKGQADWSITGLANRHKRPILAQYGPPGRGQSPRHLPIEPEYPKELQFMVKQF